MTTKPKPLLYTPSPDQIPALLNQSVSLIVLPCKDQDPGATTWPDHRLRGPYGSPCYLHHGLWTDSERDYWIKGRSPFGKPGDVFGVRERWADVNTEAGPAFMYERGALHYCTDDAYPVEYERYPGCTFTMWWSDLLYAKERKCEDCHHWRPARTMKEWAVRLHYRTLAVECRPVQTITDDELKLTGIVIPPGVPHWNHYDAFKSDFNIHHPGAFERNDHCWFARVEKCAVSK